MLDDKRIIFESSCYIESVFLVSLVLSSEFLVQSLKNMKKLKKIFFHYNSLRDCMLAATAGQLKF